MKCPLCNAEIKEGSLYCEVCGEDIHIVPDFDPVIEGTHATIGNIAQDIFVNKDNNENKDNKENKDNSDEKSGEGSSENKDNADKHTVTSDTKKLSGHSVGAVTEKLLSMPKSVNYSLIGAAFAIILAVTVLAFIFGILPLVFAIGPGSMSRKSLGVTVFGGMTAAAIIGTILVPAFYVLIQRLRENAKKARAEKKGAENE